MPCTHHNHTSSIPHTSIAVTLTLSAYTHATQTTVHTSQSQQPLHPHSVARQPHRQTKDDHMTTDRPQEHIPSSRSEINLITLQVNINGIKTNSRSSNCLFTTHMQILSQFRKPISPLKQTHPKYITSPPYMSLGCIRREVGSLHSLETTLHYLQQTFVGLDSPH